jgi:hypothetical protein
MHHLPCVGRVWGGESLSHCEICTVFWSTTGWGAILLTTTTASRDHRTGLPRNALLRFLTLLPTLSAHTLFARQSPSNECDRRKCKQRPQGGQERERLSAGRGICGRVTGKVHDLLRWCMGTERRRASRPWTRRHRSSPTAPMGESSPSPPQPKLYQSPAHFWVRVCGGFAHSQKTHQ